MADEDKPATVENKNEKENALYDEHYAEVVSKNVPEYYQETIQNTKIDEVQDLYKKCKKCKKRPMKMTDISATESW